MALAAARGCGMAHTTARRWFARGEVYKLHNDTLLSLDHVGLRPAAAGPVRAGWW